MVFLGYLDFYLKVYILFNVLESLSVTKFNEMETPETQSIKQKVFVSLW